MSLRHRLAIGFLLFSALPLGGFAIYSFASSRAALEAAARAEADSAASELSRRVELASGEIEARFRNLASLQATSWAVESGETAPGDLLDTAVAELGPAVAFLEDVRFVPPVAEAPASPPDAPAEPPIQIDVAAIAKVASGFQTAWIRDQSVDAQRVAALKAELAKVHLEITRRIEEAKSTALAQKRAAPAPPPLVPRGPDLTAERAPASTDALAPLVEGRITLELAEGDRVVGRIEGKVKAKELLASVLNQTDRDRGEIPFAIDRDGQLYTASPEDEARVANLPAVSALCGLSESDGRMADRDWIVLVRHDPATGFRFGIARPVGAAIAELRAATARNLLFGGGLIALMLAGFFPLTGSLVRDVRKLESGADLLAAGDLTARVELRRRDEIGKLGKAFNRMATQIAEHRDQLLAEERRRKEDEIARRLLAAENERRGRELEEAREFQLSLLPRELPRFEDLDLAVEMATATEVGGDYYDFQSGPAGELVLAIGDATGHGAAAGTMVTAVKSLFAAGAGSQSPAQFLAGANAAIHRMGLVRRAMALSVARVEGRRLVLSAAGMPPLLHFRASEERVEEVALAGTPLGARSEFPYREARLVIGDGDALLLLSDGLPELPNHDGEPFGYERLRRRFAELARDGRDASGIVRGLRATVAEWGGGRPLVDDVTLMVLAARGRRSPA